MEIWFHVVRDSLRWLHQLRTVRNVVHFCAGIERRVAAENTGRASAAGGSFIIFIGKKQLYW